MATPALYFLFIFLFYNGIVVRGKGFPSPLIDVYQLRESAVCGAVAVLGVCLFLWGGKNAKRKIRPA